MVSRATEEMVAIGSEYGFHMGPQSLPRPQNYLKRHTMQQRSMIMHQQNNMDPLRAVLCRRCRQEENGVVGTFKGGGAVLSLGYHSIIDLGV